MVFWDRVIEYLESKGYLNETWNDSFISLYDGVCGVRTGNKSTDELSIISHKYSYGGDEGLFEIMPGLNDDDVTGYLTFDELKEAIDIILK